MAPSARISRRQSVSRRRFFFGRLRARPTDRPTSSRATGQSSCSASGELRLRRTAAACGALFADAAGTGVDARVRTYWQPAVAATADQPAVVQRRPGARVAVAHHWHDRRAGDAHATVRRHVSGRCTTPHRIVAPARSADRRSGCQESWPASGSAGNRHDAAATVLHGVPVQQRL